MSPGEFPDVAQDGSRNIADVTDTSGDLDAFRRSGGKLLTCPLCRCPQTAIYNGSGSTDATANFHCEGNLEAPEVVCADVLTKYKHEVKGPLDFSGSGVNRPACLGDASD